MAVSPLGFLFGMLKRRVKIAARAVIEVGVLTSQDPALGNSPCCLLILGAPVPKTKPRRVCRRGTASEGFN